MGSVCLGTAGNVGHMVAVLDLLIPCRVDALLLNGHAVGTVVVLVTVSLVLEVCCASSTGG